MSRHLERLLRCLSLCAALNSPCESVLLYAVSSRTQRTKPALYHLTYVVTSAPEASVSHSRRRIEPTSSQHRLLHPPYTHSHSTPSTHHGTVTHPIHCTHRGRRALLSTTLSLRRAPHPTTTFQAMTLTVVVGPAAGRNCGLAAPPLLDSRVRSLGDRVHTLCRRGCLDQPVSAQGYCSGPPIASHTWRAGAAYDRRIACRGSL
jgi:hypothetical protein